MKISKLMLASIISGLVASFGITCLLTPKTQLGSTNGFIIFLMSAILITPLIAIIIKRSLIVAKQYSKKNIVISILALIILYFPFCGVLSPNRFAPPSKHSLLIHALGQKNNNANSSEVWITGIKVDGKAVDLQHEAQYNADQWELRDSMIGSYKNQPAALVLTVYAQKDIMVSMASHAFSGKIDVILDGKIQTIDLYNAGNEVKTIELLPETKYYFIGVINSIILYLFGFLVLLCIIRGFIHNDKNRIKKKTYRNWAISVLSLLLASLIGLAAFVYIIDPLQFYHRTNRGLFYVEERFQNPGLVKNYDYDTVIIGSSMTQNFIPSKIDQVLGGRTLKASMAGASERELSYLVKLSLESKKVNRVIWGIDLDAVINDPNYTASKDLFPVYLFDNNPFNDLQYLLNKQFINDSWDIYTKTYDSELYRADNLDTMHGWNDYVKYGATAVREFYIDKLKNNHTNNQLILSNMQENLENNILSVIKENPDTQFLLFYAPYSIVYFKHLYNINYSMIEQINEGKRYFYNELSKYPNVELYDFSSNAELTSNLNHYKDTIHYSGDINTYIIQSMKNKQYIVTADNLESSFNELEGQIKAFDMDDFLELDETK